MRVPGSLRSNLSEKPAGQPSEEGRGVAPAGQPLLSEVGGEGEEGEGEGEGAAAREEEEDDDGGGAAERPGPLLLLLLLRSRGRGRGRGSAAGALGVAAAATQSLSCGHGALVDLDPASPPAPCWFIRAGEAVKR